MNHAILTIDDFATKNTPKIADTALDLYELTDDGFSKIQDVQWSEFIYDYTVSKWVLFNPYGGAFDHRR